MRSEEERQLGGLGEEVVVSKEDNLIEGGNRGQEGREGESVCGCYLGR